MKTSYNANDFRKLSTIKRKLLYRKIWQKIILLFFMFLCAQTLMNLKKKIIIMVFEKPNAQNSNQFKSIYTSLNQFFEKSP